MLEQTQEQFEKQLQAETEQIEAKIDEKPYYFAVPKIDAKFTYKRDLEKYLSANSLSDYQIIRGKVLTTRSEVTTKIRIG